MADPAYFGSASVPADNGSNATTTLTVTPPASMQEGDLVIVDCQSRTATPTWSVGVTGGQTWTAEAASNNGRIFWCTFNGTWAADPRFDCTLSACTSAVMHVFRGQGAGYVWQQDVAFAGFNASGPITTCSVTGVTTLTNKAVVVAGWDVQAARTWTNLAGTGWAVAGGAQYRNTAQSDQSLTHAYYLAPTAGATGNVSNDKNNSTGGFDSWIMAWKNAIANLTATVDATESADTLTAVAIVAQAPIDGTLSATETADTLASLAYGERMATVAVTEAADTLSSFGSENEGRAGTLSATESADTLTSVATLPIAGSAAATENADMLEASAALAIAGSAAITEAADTLEAFMSQARQGELAVTELADTLSSAGIVTDFVPGAFGRSRAKATARPTTRAKATAAA